MTMVSIMASLCYQWVGVLLVTLLVRLLVLFYEATLKYAVIAEKKHERFIQVWSYQVLMEAPSRSMLASTDTVSVIRVSQKWFGKIAQIALLA